MSALTIEAGAALLEHILNNADWANVGDAAGLQNSTANGNLHLALHTASPGTGSSQATNECTATGYARYAIARDGTKWTVSSAAYPASAVNAAEILMAQITAGSETATHFSIGTASSGAGHKLFQAALTTPLALSAGVIPRFAAGALTITAG